MPSKQLTPVCPGELLNEDFLKPMGITKYRIAKEIGVSATRIGEIISGKRAITADTDLRLCRFFGLSDGYWLRCQMLYDLEMTRIKISRELDLITPWTTLPEHASVVLA